MSDSQNCPLVVCGFPGVGKTHLSKSQGWADSDSSAFSWSSPGVRNPSFPANYIAHIRSEHRPTLVSSHKVVRDALSAAGIPFAICYPKRECREEYLNRYRQRGSPDSFVNLLASKWDDWIDEMEAENRCFAKHVLAAGEYASDIFS